MNGSQRLKLVIVQPNPPSPSESFIRQHALSLPADVTVIHGGTPTIGDRPIKSQALLPRMIRKAIRIARRQSWQDEVTSAYLTAFKRLKPDAVLAEYGTTATDVMDACARANVPLVAHYHGYDASKHDCIAEYLAKYRVMFQRAGAIIAVSQLMKRTLIDWGAPPEKVHFNPYGVDCSRFSGAKPAEAEPRFIAVGRLVEKKSPLTTIGAFSTVLRECPTARLILIGSGPLEAQCRGLVEGLGIDAAVSFLGACPSEVVQREMRSARAFVQHSRVAIDGDAEGTPVAIIEAGATGLPVVSTRHAGIPDVVVEGVTGFLVDEGDEAGMAQHMLSLAQDPALAGRMGQAARDRITSEFSMERSLGRLWSTIESVIRNGTSC